VAIVLIMVGLAIGLLFATSSWVHPPTTGRT
jgi:hypothetical protein